MRKLCIRHIVCHTVYDGIFTLAHLLPISTTIFWTALWSSISGGSDGRRWAYQPGRAGVSKYYPARHSSQPRNRTVSNRFISYNCCQQLIRLPQIVNDRCASSLKINITQMEAFGTTPVFFTVCVCEQETEDDSIFSVSLWKSHASWNQTISFSYHCLPTSTICQRIGQGRNQIAKQKPLLNQMRAMDGWNWRCVIFFLAKQRLFWSVLAGGSGPDSAADGFLR